MNALSFQGLNAQRVCQKSGFLENCFVCRIKNKNHFMSLKVGSGNKPGHNFWPKRAPPAKARQAGFLPTGRQEGAQYERNFLGSRPARHSVIGRLFDKLRAVSSVERPCRACPVLTGWAGSFTKLW